MLIEEIKDNNDLTYKIFIDKGIKLIEKVEIIIEQYNKIRDNNEIMIDSIKKEIDFEKKINKIKVLNNNESYVEEGNDLMEKIMNKLYKLNVFLHNYIETSKKMIHDIHLNIQEIYKKLKYDIDENITYEEDIEIFNKLFSSCKDIIIDNNNDIFKYITNISNNYKLSTKIILYINSIILLGEISKKQNIKLKNIYIKIKKKDIINKLT
jgi:predicted nucleic acid-binding protein